jgi:hypothetical protein
MNGTLLTPSTRYERIPTESGLVEYHLTIREALFVVDLRRLQVDWCSCEEWACTHGKTAVKLEEKYQALHADTPCSCSLCGRMARRYQGLDLCPNCAD